MSAGTFAFPAAEPTELTPELTPEPIDSPTDPTELPTESMTPVKPLLLGFALLPVDLFRLLGREGEREDPDRRLGDWLGREPEARPFVLRCAATLELPRAVVALLRVARCDLPLRLALVDALFVLLDPFRARAEDRSLDGRVVV